MPFALAFLFGLAAAQTDYCPLGWEDEGQSGCFLPLFKTEDVGINWDEAFELCEYKVSSVFLSLFFLFFSGRFLG